MESGNPVISDSLDDQTIRIVSFVDSRNALSRYLLENLLQLQVNSYNFKVVAVCDTGSTTFISAFFSRLKSSLADSVKEFFNPDSRCSSSQEVLNLNRLSRKFQIPLVRPLKGDINDPDFIDSLKSRYTPHMAMSFFCLQIFRPRLLKVFNRAINYHNGLLPFYKGLRATSWSIYNRENLSGFTFHLMNERIDEGPILLQRALPLEKDSHPFEMDWKKALSAADCLPQLFEMIVRGDGGKPQSSAGTYYSHKEFKSIVRISNPADFTAEELFRRLQAFQVLKIRIHERLLPVTKLRIRTAGKNSARTLYSADDQYLEITRLRYLPPWLYSFYRPFETKEESVS
jgi:methionyl-tRNA formyltransferase